MEFEGRKKISLYLDMAPLIDIVFLLLIFFMLTTTSYQNQESIQIALPESKTAQTSKKIEITISIMENGEIQLNGNRINLNQLKENLVSLSVSKESNIYLQSDQNVKMKDMIIVMDEIRIAGYRNISIATNKKIE